MLDNQTRSRFVNEKALRKLRILNTLEIQQNY